MSADDKIAAELEAIRQREQAATPGPWWCDESEQAWRLHGVHAVIPSQIDWLPDQVLNHQILKAPKTGTPYAEYWPSEADAAFIVAARTDVPRLLAVAEVVPRFHQRTGLFGNAATEEEPGACPHDPDSHLHFEDADGSGDWLCEGKPEGAVCSACTEDGEPVEWPCPEYAAIAKALLGEDKNNVSTR